MAIPEKIKPTNLNDYLEIITKAVFQAGVSWAQIDNKSMAVIRLVRWRLLSWLYL